MGSNLIIVAIPNEDDRVWKVSSEKVPHLTVLFLGDSDEVSNVEEIVKFVEHAAKTSLHRFYLPVDRRDELGGDAADVLFFKKSRYDYKAIREFRTQLLQDNNIKSAYDATSQFERAERVGAPGHPWIPHLTLGYPASPAKPEKDDYGRIYEVCFNKIAVWVDDYEGPEFLLTDQWDEWDTAECVPMDVYMSDIRHYGAKGMRWGVRKEETAGGGHIRVSNKTNQAALSISGQAFGLAGFVHPRYRAEFKATREQNTRVKGDMKYKKAIEKSKRAVEVHNKAADDINGKVAAFNGDKRWKNADGNDIDLTANPTKQKEYDDAVTRELINPAYANAAVKVYGSESPSGRYKFEINDPATGTLKFRDTLREAHEAKQAKHADEIDPLEEEIEVRFKLDRDTNGHILGFSLEDAEDSMAQTMELGAEFLAHHGVKGMRWGVRKEDIERATSGSTTGVGKALRDVNRLAGDIEFESDTAPQVDEFGFESSSKAKDQIIDSAYTPYRKEDLPALKARHPEAGRFRSRVLHPLSKETKAYRKDARETYIKRLETTANSMKNDSKKREYTIREQGGKLPDSQYYWEVSTREARHAAGDNFTLLQVVMDDDGFITDLKKVELDTSMAQSAIGIDLSTPMSELMHYGVKGMRWGVRRSDPSAVEVTAASKVPHGAKRKTKIETDGGENHPATSDAIKVAQHRAKLKKSGAVALTNSELREVAQRMQLEQQVKQLTTSSGRKFVTGFLKTQGQQQSQNLLNEQVRDFKKGRRVAA